MIKFINNSKLSIKIKSYLLRVRTSKYLILIYYNRVKLQYPINQRIIVNSYLIMNKFLKNKKNKGKESKKLANSNLEKTLLKNK